MKRSALKLDWRLALEVVVVIGLVGFAAWRFWCPASVAENLPQESCRYVPGAWNLYKTGRYMLTLNHREYPPAGGLGYALLIVPSFWFFGDNIGNAIYTQFALSLLTCLGLYCAARICFGPWHSACAAALLPLYPKFNEYARVNDSSPPVAFFFVAAMLVSLLVLRGGRGQFGKWILWGFCAGWAVAIRRDTAVIFAMLTVALLWQTRPALRAVAKNLAAAAVGAIPVVLPIFWYNHRHYGHWLRDGLAYWESNPFDVMGRQFALRWAFGFPDYEKSVNYGGHFVFYVREILAQFSSWQDLMMRGPLLRVTVLCLSGVMVVGLVCIWRGARRSVLQRQFFWFSTITVGAMIVFYSFLAWREVRYTVFLAPMVAGWVGVGTVEAARWLWRRPQTRVLIVAITVAIGVPANEWSKTKPTRIGDMVPRAEVLKFTNRHTELNAVVIASTHWQLVDHFVIRGTQRQYVPTNNKVWFRVQPNPPKDPSKIPWEINRRAYEGQLDNGAVDLIDFSAMEDPGRVQQLLDQGLPVYFVDFSFGLWSREELMSLHQHFDLISVGSGIPPGELRSLFRQPATFLWRLRSRRSGF